ncbi:MAG TPA: hypothetical protein DEA85_08695, partial [Firmicutes bacterium]|nr:hypothetical protein [Bacillota bacterium]
QGKGMAVLPVDQGEAQRVAVASAGPVRYPVFPGETLSFTTQVQVPAKLSAPVRSGQPVGTALVRVDGGWTAEIELVAVSAVEKKAGIATRLFELVRGWWHDQ